MKLSKQALAFLRRCVRESTGTEPLWLADDEDPGPMIECRRAGLVTSDVYAIMPTAKGIRAAATGGEGAE